MLLGKNPKPNDIQGKQISTFEEIIRKRRDTHYFYFQSLSFSIINIWKRLIYDGASNKHAVLPLLVNNITMAMGRGERVIVEEDASRDIFGGELALPLHSPLHPCGKQTSLWGGGGGTRARSRSPGGTTPYLPRCMGVTPCSSPS